MEVQIKAAGWRYRLKSTGKFASPVERGATVDLSLVNEEDVERGRRHGVFIEQGTSDSTEPADTSGAPFDQGIGPLADWLREAKLNVHDTVQLAGGNGTKARMLIDAEPAATSGKPRAGVLKALGQVIVRAEEAGDDEQSTPADDADETSTSEDADGDEGTAPAADDENDPDAAGAGDDDDPEE